MDMNVFIHEPASEYHSKAKDYLSSHQLMDFIRCPWAYRQKQMQIMEETDATAFLIGQAAHSLILEGREVYESEFAIGGPINPSTGKSFGPTSKKFQEWAATQEKTVLPADKADLIEQMLQAVERSELARDLLQTGEAECVIRTNYCSTPCQIRIDWFNPNYGLVDLKTCDDLEFFPHDAKKYKYHNQMAFYQAVLKEVTGEYFPVYFIAVEKKEPLRCGVWQILQETLDNARGENRAAIERLKLARDTNVWPTGYEELRYLTIN